MERQQFVSIDLMQADPGAFAARVKQYGQVIVTVGKLRRYAAIATDVVYIEDAVECAERNFAAGLCPPALRYVGNVSLAAYCEDVVKSIKEQADRPNTVMVLPLDDGSDDSVALQMLVPGAEGVMLSLNTEFMASLREPVEGAMSGQEVAEMLGIEDLLAELERQE